MRGLIGILLASYTLTTQAIETTDKRTFDSLDLQDGGRKLIREQVDMRLLQADTNSDSGCNVPSSVGTEVITEPISVGQFSPFDGGFKTYKRDVAFESGALMTRENAVFVVQAGGLLRNVIISGGGGVFCEMNNCRLDQVWFKDSVQGALHINSGTGITTINGGGALNVAGSVVFGQGSGTVVVSGGFCMENSGMLFDSCGWCGPVMRAVVVDGLLSVNPTAELIRMNSNYKDCGTIAQTTVLTATDNYELCTQFEGGAVPAKVGSGASPPVCAITSAVTVRSP
ncbi:unnamed protein product [Peronospora farinosa]|uniref:Probable pectate lyase F n=1 Tax=Peronospora farinosa TaxID=134698 RepID=A0AAV0T9W8_9STRA|nr:unnamed protein product [Peronospora farinosa]CAI5715000.1 unnamed protein product [Peronospora farinosa]